MSDLEQALFWIFYVWFGWQIIQVSRIGQAFFNKLEKEHPEYHTAIGHPSYKSFAFIRNYKARRFINGLIMNGVPNSFPKDSELRKQAKNIRKRWIVMFIAFAVFFAISIFL